MAQFVYQQKFAAVDKNKIFYMLLGIILFARYFILLIYVYIYARSSDIGIVSDIILEKYVLVSHMNLWIIGTSLFC